MNKKETKESTALVVQIKNEINRQLGDAETLKSLLVTTFKGLEASAAKRAMMEGMLRGFKFEDFLKKNIYAIPFKESYSLVTSIDYARKIGARSNVVGKSKPLFTMNGKLIVSCEITVKKRLNGYVGDFTAEVYFDEYYKAGRNGYPSLWDSKPRTMIAKVAEMHALRMACPEEMSQLYTEEEFDKDRNTEVYDRSEVADDVEVISTGDDIDPEIVRELEDKTNKNI